MKKIKTMIAWTPSYEAFAKELKPRGEVEFVEIERKNFKDGELYDRILSDCRDRDIILVGGTHTDEEFMELYDLISGLVSGKAKSITIVLPYFRYSTMERKSKPGEIVKAKTRVNILSTIEYGATRRSVFMVDLHVEGMTQYFPTPMHPENIQLTDLLLQQAKELVIGISQNDLLMASADASRGAYLEWLAGEFHCGMALVYKHRKGDGDTEVTTVLGEVEGKTLVIYDDMVRTGSTVLKAAAAYKQRGAKAVHVMFTHAVLIQENPDTLVDELLHCDAIDSISVTDTHPHHLYFAHAHSPKVHIIKSSEYIGKHI